MQHLKKLEALGGKEKGAVDLGSAATAEEMNAIQKFLKKFESYEESIRFLSVVGQVKGGKERRCLIVLGNYMMFTVKEGTSSIGHHNKGKSKISEVICYIDLVHVKYDGNKVLIKVRQKQEVGDKKRDKEKKGGQETKLLNFNCQSSSQLVEVLRQECGKIFASYPTNLKPSFPLNASALSTLSLLECDPSTASNLLFTYRAYCVQMKTRVSPEFLCFIEDLIAVSSTDLPLSECPGAFAKSSITPSLHPAFKALSHNNHFLSCVLVDSANKEVVPEIASTILRHNRTMTKIVMSSLSASNDWPMVGVALRRNQFHNFQILDFSNNRMDYEALASLGRGIQAFTHGLRELNLSNCSIPSKGIAALFKSFCCNLGVSLSIQFLDISFNQMDEPSSQAMAEWLNIGHLYSKLIGLNIAGTGALMVLVAKYFRCLPYLKSLNVSENKLDMADCQVLNIALDTTSSLEKVSIARCVTKPDLVVPLLNSLVGNKALKNKEVSLDMSKNKVEEREIQPMCQALTLGSETIVTLDLTAIKMKEKDLSAVLFSLGKDDVTGRKSVLKHLIVDYCALEQNPPGYDEVGRALIRVLENCPNLVALSARGFGSKILLPVLSSLNRCPSLRELRISDNDLRDSGASVLARCLRSNTTLRFLECDDNFISVNGWKAIALAFRFNRSLCYFGHPWEDYNRCLSRIPAQKHEKLRETITKIQACVTQNAVRLGVSVGGRWGWGEEEGTKEEEFFFVGKGNYEGWAGEGEEEEGEGNKMKKDKTPTGPYPLEGLNEKLQEIQRNNTLMDIAQREGLDDELLKWEGTIHEEGGGGGGGSSIGGASRFSRSTTPPPGVGGESGGGGGGRISGSSSCSSSLANSAMSSFSTSSSVSSLSSSASFSSSPSLAGSTSPLAQSASLSLSGGGGKKSPLPGVPTRDLFTPPASVISTPPHAPPSPLPPDGEWDDGEEEDEGWESGEIYGEDDLDDDEEEEEEEEKKEGEVEEGEGGGEGGGGKRKSIYFYKATGSTPAPPPSAKPAHSSTKKPPVRRRPPPPSYQPPLPAVPPLPTTAPPPSVPTTAPPPSVPLADAPSPPPSSSSPPPPALPLPPSSPPPSLPPLSTQLPELPNQKNNKRTVSVAYYMKETPLPPSPSRRPPPIPSPSSSSSSNSTLPTLPPSPSPPSPSPPSPSYPPGGEMRGRSRTDVGAVGRGGWPGGPPPRGPPPRPVPPAKPR